MMCADYSLDFRDASLTLAPVTSPFRDEIETLRRENERLHAELARARTPRTPRIAVSLALVGLDVTAAMLLRPWLNAGSDGRFWAALCMLGAITLAAGIAAVGYKLR
jgi:hypothetical protein